MLRKLYDGVVGCLPGLWAGWLDFHLRKGLKSGLGGPLNGQKFRQAMFREILAGVRLEAIVETGTYRGTTTEFLSGLTDLPVYTVEINPRFYAFARLRFRNSPNIRGFFGDSRPFLAQLFRTPGFPKKRTLFFLDAHWGSDLPLMEEVRQIESSCKEAIIVIDDFQVPGDPGYGFDDYGEGKSLKMDSLRLGRSSSFEIFWPAVPSSLETGQCRGAVILATRDAILPEIEGIASLRKHSG